MNQTIKSIKDILYSTIVDGNTDIKREYDTYVREHIDEHSSNRLRHWAILLRLNIHYRIFKSSNGLFYQNKKNNKPQLLDYYKHGIERKSVDELCAILSEYDVISFDIFDTALYRKVEFPNDVFVIMAIEMGHNDFTSIRKKAESEARIRKERRAGTREITLIEIYDILESCYGIDRKWMNREIELEIELSIPNPYILEVYSRMKAAQKIIVFMSDMYLSVTTLEKMLSKNGYSQYEKLYVSNEYGVRKGDGKLQKILLKDYEKKKIIHIGDNEASDVKKSIEVGLAALYNPPSNLPYRESDMDNLSGSFYGAIINTQLNNGLWNHTLHYEHGFRVGGILAVGFCQYINRLAKSKNIDKIFFCARDCAIIHQIYNKYFKEYENEYIQISRYAIMSITSERYLYDWTNRYLMRFVDRYKSTKTIGTIFCESGFDYLVEYLEKDDIDQFLFPSAIDRRRIEQFIFRHKHIIEQHNLPYVKAAKKYFSSLIGTSQNILVVDIGWSGTCITALKYFIEKNLPEKKCQISGALMCTSRGLALTTSMCSGELEAFIYSPFQNMDLTRAIMPGGARGRSEVLQDQLHMPLEYLFTSVEQSLAYYKEDDDGNIVFQRTRNTHSNVAEIQEIQQGMIDFASLYRDYTFPYQKFFVISPYVAFNPLKSSIGNKVYTQEIYQNFTYDVASAPFSEEKVTNKFSSLFNDEILTQLPVTIHTREQKKILFVTPELIYTGAPRSLLRMCKVALALGYLPIVWSAKPGPFISEYEQNNIKVEIIPEKDLGKRHIINLIKSFDMAVCNTIVTDRYARMCSFYIPTVWYIREATNIPDFTRNDPLREYTLTHSRNLYCVSDYAAHAIKKFTKHKVSVVHNSVEDETNMATSYIAGSAEKVRFVQFGTMEYRKGYDVLLAAYLAMPAKYQDKAELFFAGGFINSGTPYCSYLFSQMEGIKNVHYLGIVRGEQNKIKTLSQMDVVVVASRDESCSLVALEGAMLSKPLIVTENVGAKYIVSEQNGFIVKTGDIHSLKSAMMRLIDNQTSLADMGAMSRKMYEQYASMNSYTSDMAQMFSLTNKKHSIIFFAERMITHFENSSSIRLSKMIYRQIIHMIKPPQKADVIVSLTSHPERINTVAPCIESLLQQTQRPRKVLLYLSKEQFPNQESELPQELVRLRSNKHFEIRWVDDDLKPHKKYYYSMQEYPDLPIIIADDDVIYENTLVEKLMNSYHKFPHCISAMRANLMMFRRDGRLRKYDGWLMGYRMLLDTPSYQLMPTGVGGVLYPPHSIPKEAFNISAIKTTCLYTDDLWLKMYAVMNQYPTVVPRDYSKYHEIEGTRETALWRINVHKNNNDVSIQNIISYFDKREYPNLLEIIRRDRFC